MGTNSKLNVQFVDRHWRTLGGNGDTYADTGYQATWEVTRAQSGAPGILVDYTGGLIGASFGTGTPRTRAERFPAQLEPVFPGIRSKLNGRATIDFWPASPYQPGPTPTGRSASTRRSPASNASAAAAATSPASTRRSTSRATSTAPSKPDNAPPPRSSATSRNYSTLCTSTRSGAISARIRSSPASRAYVLPTEVDDRLPDHVRVGAVGRDLVDGSARSRSSGTDRCGRARGPRRAGRAEGGRALPGSFLQVEQDLFTIPVHPDRGLVRRPVLAQGGNDVGEVRLVVQECRLALGRCRHPVHPSWLVLWAS